MLLQYTLQNGETRKSHFHSNDVLVHYLNLTRCLNFDFFNLFDSRLTLTMLPKSCNQCVQRAGLFGAWFRRKQVEIAAGVGLCCMHNAPVRCLPLCIKEYRTPLSPRRPVIGSSRDFTRELGSSRLTSMKTVDVRCRLRLSNLHAKIV